MRAGADVKVDCCVMVSAIVDVGGEVEVVAGGVAEVGVCGDEDAEVAGDDAPQAGWQPAEQ